MTLEKAVDGQLLAGWLPSQAEQDKWDATTIAAGVSGLELMERAAKALVEILEKSNFVVGERLLILCGPGNNGGDGLALSRIYCERGLRPLTILVNADRYSEENQIELKRLLSLSGSVYGFPKASAPIEEHQLAAINKKELFEYLNCGGVIIDALLGNGQHSAPRGTVRELLEFILLSDSFKGNRIVAIDLPTGINGDTGQVYHPHLDADLTLTIERPQRGLLQHPARQVSGKVMIVPVNLNTSSAAEYFLNDTRSVPRPPRRKAVAHKGNFGQVLVVGGSHRMPGAPFLSAEGALQCGAGLVCCAHLAKAPLPRFRPEIILVPCGEHRPANFFDSDHFAELKSYLARSVLVIGPGLGTNSATGMLLWELLAASDKTIILDADALNLLAIHWSEGGNNPVGLERCILTPHPGEMGRLLGGTSEQVQADRYSAARELCERSGAVVVLKGASTIVYSIHNGLGRGWVNQNGNPYLATAGSGDVLGGMIAGLVAQGMIAAEAAQLGVFLHGLAADTLQVSGARPITASELIAEIPDVWVRLEDGHAV